MYNTNICNLTHIFKQLHAYILAFSCDRKHRISPFPIVLLITYRFSKMLIIMDGS